VVIPAGSFVMGSDKDSDEMPPHKVMISSFLIGKAEITQAQWLDVMGTKPSRFSECGQNCPVESVSWDDIQQFITNLNQKTGRKYRLPSEAEWEYAARGGTTTQWSHGNDESKLGNYAWHGVNSREKTQVVGQKLPNGFGLFDMHGNVWEWTEDCYHGNYAEAPNDGSVWTTACMNNQRVLRGGSWDDFFPAYLRSAYRHRAFPDNRFSSFGFRLARDL
jgi:formylglycine-generating enzyme required for sulfatase activity